MLAHLGGIAQAEGAAPSPEALALIVRAAEGSVRDALSLMDQAIAHGGGATSAEQVRAMLGLADRGRVLDLFEMILRGDAKAALDELGGQYAEGADPMAVLRDLAEVTHWVSLVKISPEAADDPTVGPDERARGLDLAGRLGMRALTRMWQMLLKALEEVAAAPNAMMAAEMAVIRLTHVADLPTPEDLVRRLSGAAPVPAAVPAAPAAGGNGAAPRGAAVQSGPVAQAVARAPETLPAAEAAPTALARYATFEDVLALIRARRDVALLIEVEKGVRLVRYAPGRIEFEPADAAAPDLAARLGQRLQSWTGARWGVSVVGTGGGPTVAELREAEKDREEAEARAHPFVQAALKAFPGAKLIGVRRRAPVETEMLADPEDPGAEDGDWEPVDPFEEEN
jgi:DNA polymerase-3 subunit gamma/tau